MNIKMLLAYIVIYVIGIVGCWFITSYFLVIPSRKARKTVKSYSAKEKSEKAKSNSVDLFLESLSMKFVKYVHVNDIKRSEMSKALYISNNPKTPEEYMAYIYTVSGLFAIVGVAAFLINKLIGGGLIILAIITYVYNIKKLNSKKKQAVESLEMELPRYCAYLKQAFKTNKNVLSVMEGYLSENRLFISETKQAIADAKTSNFASSMARLDQRVNSDRMKMVIHGLLSAFNGENVEIYFAMLEKDFSAFEVNVLKKAIKSIPQRMQLPKILLFTSIFATMFTPLAMQIVESFKAIFQT